MVKIIEKYEVSGIYKITNIVNFKSYIGSATCLKSRLYYSHLKELRDNIHYNKKLQNAFNKYGEQNFTFEILEECEKEKLIEREQYYFDTLKPEYNICQIAGNTLGVKRSDETKLLLSQINKGKPNLKNRKPKSDEVKEKISKTLKGRKLSDEVRSNMSRGMTGKVKTKEHLEKIANKLRGRKRSPQEIENYKLAIEKRKQQKCIDQNRSN